MVLDATDLETLTASALKLLSERFAKVGSDTEEARLESHKIALLAIAALQARPENEMEKNPENPAGTKSLLDAVVAKMASCSGDPFPFMTAMHPEIPIPNPPISPEEQALVANLTSQDLAVIDATILSSARPWWQKVAMVVSRTLDELEDRYPELTDAFIAERVQALVNAAQLESQGNLHHMRFSEVRRAQDPSQPEFPENVSTPIQ